MNEILNPYIAGAPVVETSMFFGREAVFSWIERSLAGKFVDHILVLHGQRRVGKTSVLKQIPNFLPDKYIQVFFDLQGRTNTTLARFLWWLAREIVRTLQQERGIALPRPDRTAFEDDPDYLINEFLPGLKPTLGDQVLLLTFDEFDTLDHPEIQETLSIPLINYLRRLMEFEGLSFIFSIGSSGNKLENMQASYTDFFKSALYRKISFLTKDDCISLITRPVEGVLSYSPKAIDLIYEITSGHPYFTQLMCHELFSLCQKTGLRTIQLEHVDAVLDDVIERGTVNLKFVWDEATDLEKWILASLAQSEIGTTTRQLHAILQGQQIRFSEPDIYSAIIRLRDKDVLNRDNQFVVYLLLLWLQRNRPVDRVREELTEVNLIANRYIEIADTFRDQGQAEKALENYRYALEADPHCLDALVNVGNILLEKMDFKDAAAVYEAALSIDNDNITGLTGYCDTYLAWGDQLLKAGDSEDAIHCYQEVLGINPEHLEARGRLAALYRDQAEADLASGQDEAALIAFQTARKHSPDDTDLSEYLQGVMAEKVDPVLASLAARAEDARKNSDWESAITAVQNALLISGTDENLQAKLAQLQADRRDHLLTILPGQAGERAKDEAWDEVITAWQDYLVLDPPDPETAQAALEQARQMKVIQGQYAQALDKMQAKDYPQAIELLREVIQVDPGYKDTSHQLASAVEASRRTRPNWRRIAWLSVPVLLVAILAFGYLGIRQRGGWEMVGIWLDSISFSETDSIHPGTPTPEFTPVPSPTPELDEGEVPSDEPTDIQKAKDFSDPILATIAESQPSFEDDFTTEQDYWQETSVAFSPWGQSEQGTDIPISDLIVDGAIHIQDEPAEEYTYGLGITPFSAEDYVLQLDFTPHELHYGSKFHLDFENSAGQRYSFEMSTKTGTQGKWTLDPSHGDPMEGQTRLEMGQTYQIQLIVKGDQIALTKDGIYLAYLEDDRIKIDHMFQIWFSAYRPIDVEIDNLKFWDLDCGEINLQGETPSEDFNIDSVQSYVEAQPPTFEDDYEIWEQEWNIDAINTTDFETDGVLNRDFEKPVESLGWSGDLPEAADFALEFEYLVEESGRDIFIDVDFRWGAMFSYVGYYLEIKPIQGTWKLVKFGFPPQVLGSGEIPGSSVLGQLSKVKLIVLGDQIEVAFNDEQMGVFRDDKWSGKLQRFSLGTVDESANVRLDKVKFWNLDGVDFLSSEAGDQPVEVLPTTTQVFEGAFTDLDWGANGLLAAIGDESSAVILDAATGEINQDLSDQEQIFRTLAWHPNGETLTLGTASGVLRFYQLQDTWQGPWDIYTLTYYGGINDISYTADGDKLAAVVDGKTGVYSSQMGIGGYVGIWDTTNNARNFIIKYFMHDDAQGVDWMPDGNTFLTAGTGHYGGGVSGLRVNTVDNIYEYTKVSDQIRPFDISPDGSYLATYTMTGIEIYTDFEDKRLYFQHGAKINDIAWSPDSQYLATAGVDGILNIWDIPNNLGKSKVEPFQILTTGFEITTIVWSPDGTHLAAGDANGSLWVWNLEGIEY